MKSEVCNLFNPLASTKTSKKTSADRLLGRTDVHDDEDGAGGIGYRLLPGWNAPAGFEDIGCHVTWFVFL